TNSSLFRGEKESIYSLTLAGGTENKISVQLKGPQGDILLDNLNSRFLIKNVSQNRVILIFDVPMGSGNFWAGQQDNQYRGVIEVVPENGNFQLINLINLEEYLYGVLPSEMPAKWPRQALNTQAIAARTWAMSNLSRHKQEGFNFCSTVHCQVYKGVSTETATTNQAVDDTAGQILASASRSIDIFYSTNCGGYTRDGVADAVYADYAFFSPSGLDDWLRGRPEAFCNLKEEKGANFRWSRLYKREELEAILRKNGIDVGSVISIIPDKREASGHLASVKIKGQDNTIAIEREYKIRKILGNLRSSAFKIDVKYNQSNLPEEFIFYGGGFGHARGLCQTGVKGMALKGLGYNDILRHYYPDAQVEKIY
ncbi:SpoIID/LytB domain-containing protein, partial [Candidatus Omnitrophota bacterium]